MRRAELTDAADVALRRMTREIRQALPNSLRVSGNCIEFIATICSRLRPLMANTGAVGQSSAASCASMALRRLTAPP